MTSAPAQRTYWTGSGSSRPYSALSRRTTLAGSGFSLSHGPPFTECMSTKVMSDTANRTGTIHSTRRTR